MDTEDELRAMLADPVETVRLDFKGQVGTSTHDQIELARDIVCLANRSGGWIIVGVEDLKGGRWKPVGMAADQGIPDPTDLGKLIRKYFDPLPRFDCREVVLDGARYGVIRVEEFGKTPIVCKAIANDENGVAMVRPGDLVRRSDSMECAKLDSANAVQELIESGVAKTGAAVVRMFSPAGQATASTAAVETLRADLPLSTQSEPMRICNLIPHGVIRDQAFHEILSRMASSVVRLYGGVVVPRSIEPMSLEPSAVVREPNRILIERTRQSTYGGATSVIEVTRGLQVRLREGLWEAEGTTDFSAVVAFVLGCLLFAKRFFGDLGLESIDLEIGLTQVLGRRLVDDPSRYNGFNQTYVATTGLDLIVRRGLTMGELDDADRRVPLAKEIVKELISYFGWVVNDDSWDAHLKNLMATVTGIAD